MLVRSTVQARAAKNIVFPLPSKIPQLAAGVDLSEAALRVDGMEVGETEEVRRRGEDEGGATSVVWGIETDGVILGLAPVERD